MRANEQMCANKHKLARCVGARLFVGAHFAKVRQQSPTVILQSTFSGITVELMFDKSKSALKNVFDIFFKFSKHMLIFFYICEDSVF